MQLNASKAELIWFGSQTSLCHLKPEDRVLEIGPTVVQTVSTCFYHLRRLRQLRRHVDMDALKQLVCAFILLVWITVTRWYMGCLTQPSAIYNVCRIPPHWSMVTLGLSTRDHVHPALKELHWLPVTYQIQYKMALLMYMVHINRWPQYLRDTIVSAGSEPWHDLRSAINLTYIFPTVRTKFGERAFSVSGSIVWNSLPSSVSLSPTLKSHFWNCF